VVRPDAGAPLSGETIAHAAARADSASGAWAACPLSSCGTRRDAPVAAERLGFARSISLLRLVCVEALIDHSPVSVGSPSDEADSVRFRCSGFAQSLPSHTRQPHARANRDHRMDLKERRVSWARDNDNGFGHKQAPEASRDG
jgi:hypothetical protein